MNHIRSLGAVTTFLFLAGCAMFRLPVSDVPSAPVAEAKAVPQGASSLGPGQIKVSDEAGDVVVQTLEFRPGTSSATVERLAKRFGCTGEQGAGLVTEKGPVEVYRMKCENGTTFIARCELRQCRPMR